MRKAKPVVPNLVRINRTLYIAPVEANPLPYPQQYQHSGRENFCDGSNISAI